MDSVEMCGICKERAATHLYTCLADEMGLGDQFKEQLFFLFYCDQCESDVSEFAGRSSSADVIFEKRWTILKTG